MDQNKLKVLNDIGYAIRKTCATCEYSLFTQARGNNWGLCFAKTYEHLKHTGPERQLSINKFGHCPQYAWDWDKVTKEVGVAYSEFVEK